MSQNGHLPIIYTLLDLRNLCIAPNTPSLKEFIEMLIAHEKSPDGGVRPIGPTKESDVCINGMFLNYAAYFKVDEEKLTSIVDFILAQHMADGGFNCRSNRSGAKHSSMHSTISVLEGFTEYEKNGYTYRLEEIGNAAKASQEFILQHRFYVSDRTGKIIHKDFLRLSYPGRWKYDILRALDYFQYARIPWDERMHLAIAVLLKKRNKNKTWNLQAKHPGQTHFEMEKAGQPSRWNTLRAMRVLNHYKIEY